MAIFGALQVNAISITCAPFIETLDDYLTSTVKIFDSSSIIAWLKYLRSYALQITWNIPSQHIVSTQKCATALQILRGGG